MESKCWNKSIYYFKFNQLMNCSNKLSISEHLLTDLKNEFSQTSI